MERRLKQCEVGFAKFALCKAKTALLIAYLNLASSQLRVKDAICSVSGGNMVDYWKRRKSARLEVRLYIEIGLELFILIFVLSMIVVVQGPWHIRALNYWSFALRSNTSC